MIDLNEVFSNNYIRERKIDYLRISVTDRCNLRCIYCMPRQGVKVRPREEILCFEEIVRLTKIFASLGISKVRLTGGEPLIRNGIVHLVQALDAIEEIKEVSLTTNAALLSSRAGRLKKVGLKRINISLDTLKEDRFRKITGSNCFLRVLEGIDTAKRAGFDCLKLNVVVMKGVNDDEIIDFVEFALSNGLILRFIEFMNITPLWKAEYFMSMQEIKNICERRFCLKEAGSFGPGPAVYYLVDKEGLIGFIDTSQYNCQRCNRLRLTSHGQLKICLYQPGGFCLRSFLRQGISDEGIRDAIRKKWELKRNGPGAGRLSAGKETAQLYMCAVGG